MKTCTYSSIHFCSTGDWIWGHAHAVHTLGKHPTSKMDSYLFFRRFHFEMASKQVVQAGFRLICSPGKGWPCYPPASAPCIAEIISLHTMAWLGKPLNEKNTAPKGMSLPLNIGCCCNIKAVLSALYIREEECFCYIGHVLGILSSKPPTNREVSHRKSSS